MFTVDNRGTSLFVMLTYPLEIGERFRVTYDAGVLEDFARHVVFVALKNGEHDGIGYLIDTADEYPRDAELPLTELFRIVDRHFGEYEQQPQAQALSPNAG